MQHFLPGMLNDKPTFMWMWCGSSIWASVVVVCEFKLLAWQILVAGILIWSSSRLWRSSKELSSRVWISLDHGWSLIRSHHDNMHDSIIYSLSIQGAEIQYRGVLLIYLGDRSFSSPRVFGLNKLSGFRQLQLLEITKYNTLSVWLSVGHTALYSLSNSHVFYSNSCGCDSRWF